MSTALSKKEMAIRKKELAASVIMGQVATISRWRVNPEDYKEAVIEAILLNPDLIGAKDADFANAIRRCCQDGLVPNGREAVLYPTRGGGVAYVQMKEGVLKIIYNATEAEIHSGHIKEGDEYDVEENIGRDPTIKLRKLLTADSTKRQVIGAWCWMKIGNKSADFILLDRSDIESARSNAPSPNSPAWKNWYGSMAEKVAIKKLMTQQRYKALSDKNRYAFDAMENDDSMPQFDTPPTTVEISTVEEPETQKVAAKKNPMPISQTPSSDEEKPKIKARKGAYREEEEGGVFVPNEPPAAFTEKQLAKHSARKAREKVRTIEESMFDPDAGPSMASQAKELAEQDARARDTVETQSFLSDEDKAEYRTRAAQAQESPSPYPEPPPPDEPDERDDKYGDTEL